MNNPQIVTTAHGDIRSVGSETVLTEPAVPLVNVKGVRVMAWTAFAFLNILYILACLQRVAVPGAIFNDLQSDLGMKGSLVAGLGSVYVMIYATVQIFAGMIVDRIGGKQSGILGGFFLAAGLCLFALAQSVPMLYISRAISAIGQSFFYLCVVKLCHLLFPPRQFGALIGLSMAIGMCGSVTGTMPTQRVSEWIGWRHAFMILGFISAFASIAMAVVLRKFHERRKGSSVVTWKSVVNLFNDHGRRCFMIFHFWCFPAFFVLQTILGQKFIQDYCGLPASKASLFTMLMTFSSIILCLASARILRMFNNRRKIPVYISVALPVVASVIMALGIKFGYPVWVFLTCFALMSISQCSSAATSALMSEITDTKTIAFSAAVRNFFPYAGCAIMGWICGAVLDKFATAPDASGVIHYPHDAYLWCLALMFISGFIGVIVTIGIPETRGEHIYTQK